MADAAVTLHQKRHHGLAAAHADASMAISVATAGLAAICAAREWNKKGGGGVGGAAAQHKE